MKLAPLLAASFTLIVASSAPIVKAASLPTSRPARTLFRFVNELAKLRPFEVKTVNRLLVSPLTADTDNGYFPTFNAPAQVVAGLSITSVKLVSPMAGSGALTGALLVFELGGECVDPTIVRLHYKARSDIAVVTDGGPPPPAPYLLTKPTSWGSVEFSSDLNCVKSVSFNYQP